MKLSDHAAPLVRLLVISLASLAAFFICFIGLTLLTGNRDIGVSCAVIALVITPWIIAKFWPAPSASRICPEGKGLYPECMTRVEIIDDTLIITQRDGKIERMAWSELAQFNVVTNDTGPWGSDVRWVFTDAQGRSIEFAQGATGEKVAMDRLQALEGFDNMAFISSMGSTGNAKFVCWKK